MLIKFPRSVGTGKLVNALPSAEKARFVPLIPTKEPFRYLMCVKESIAGNVSGAGLAQAVPSGEMTRLPSMRDATKRPLPKATPLKPMLSEKTVDQLAR